MSGNDVVRRTWNKEEYEKKAQERRQAERDAGEERRRKVPKVQESANADDPFGPSRAWLEPGMAGTVDFEGKVGKTQVVTEARDKKSGFYCSVCNSLLKDSNAYLGHMNSKLHHKQLGMSMRTKRSTYEEVQFVFESLRRVKRGLSPLRPQAVNSGNQSETERDAGPQETLDEAGTAVRGSDGEDTPEIRVARSLGLPTEFTSTKHAA